MPIDNIIIDKIIRSYLDLYLINNISGDSKNISLRKRRSFLKKIFASKAEIKHTNNKAIITLYTVNLKKNILYEKHKK
jgi:hypothetical protein